MGWGGVGVDLAWEWTGGAHEPHEPPGLRLAWLRIGPLLNFLSCVNVCTSSELPEQWPILHALRIEVSSSPWAHLCLHPNAFQDEESQIGGIMNYDHMPTPWRQQSSVWMGKECPWACLLRQALTCTIYIISSNVNMFLIYTVFIWAPIFENATPT